jgi:hypothetical protein
VAEADPVLQVDARAVGAAVYDRRHHALDQCAIDYT